MTADNADGQAAEVAQPGEPAGTRAELHGITVTRLVSLDGACATVADHGGHLLSWQPAGGNERLFLSTASGFGAGQAIRGGVPVIFPQFGERGLGRRHGMARLLPWQFHSAWHDGIAAMGEWQLRGFLDRPQPDAPAVDLVHAGEPPAGASTNTDAFAFALTLRIRLAGDSLAISLRIDNTGRQAWQCHAALHTYLQVADLAGVTIDGLQGVPFIDSAAPQASQAATSLIAAAPAVMTPGESGPVRFTGEVDRLYASTPGEVILVDGATCLVLRQEGFGNTVVWNPGVVKGRALADLPPGGHAGFVCIEAAAVLDPVCLAPGASWRGVQHLRTAPRRDDDGDTLQPA